MSAPTNLIDQLKRDEGLRLTAYQDTSGVWTIGYGHNLEAHPPFQATCTQAEADAWLEQDAANACKWLAEHMSWTDRLVEARRAALQNMSFQLREKLLQFHRSLTYIEQGLLGQARAELLNSKWAKECVWRAYRIAMQIETGEWQ